MKLLFISNIGGKSLGNFSKSSILAAKELGIEFHIAANWSNASVKLLREDEKRYGIKVHHIDFIRNPFHPKNVRAVKQLLSLINEEKFDAIHCNTPIGGVSGRICGKLLNVPRVIYTAHGFHFYEGAPLVKNKLIKFAEMILAQYTDAIITINQEDYKAAKNFKLRNNGHVYLVHGVGIDTNELRNVQVDKTELRRKLNLKNDDIVMIAMGDLIKRKNYEVAIRAIAETKRSNIHFLICGTGPMLDTLKSLSEELGVSDHIHFLGYRSDIKELLSISDIFLFTTYQEGLPRSMMEAMAAGLPCIASKIRGNIDLIEDGKGGFLYHPDDVEGFTQAINILINDKDLRNKMSHYNLKRIKKFDIYNVKNEMKDIYFKELFSNT